MANTVCIINAIMCVCQYYNNVSNETLLLIYYY